MRPTSVVMASPLFDGHLQMALVKRDQEVQALATYCPPNRSHTELPWALAPAFGDLALRAPSLPCPVPWRRCYPGRGSRIDTDGRPEVPSGIAAGSNLQLGGGHVVLNNSPGVQLQDHEYIKDAETGSEHDEEVARHDHLGMVVNEGQRQKEPESFPMPTDEGESHATPSLDQSGPPAHPAFRQAILPQPWTLVRFGFRPIAFKNVMTSSSNFKSRSRIT